MRIKRSNVIVMLISSFFVAGCSAQKSPGMFSEAKNGPFPVGQHPADLILIDVNLDNKLDIVTANANAKDVSVLLGDGQGGFSPSQGSPFKIKDPPHLISAGDLNKDGNPDLALTSHDRYEVMILLGDGKGGFRGSEFLVKALEQEKAHNHGLGLADFNADGNLDIATSNNGDNSISALLGDGAGEFALTKDSPYAVGRQPYPLVVNDVNRDLNLDILIPNVGSSNISILYGDGKGGLMVDKASTITVAARPYFLTVGDLNNDTNPDLVISHDDVTFISLLYGDGKGRFKAIKNTRLEAGKRVWKMVVEDFNSDNKNDIALAAVGDNSVIVLMGNGKGDFAPAPGSPYSVGSWHSGLAAGDVNSDGKPDIVVADPDSNDVTVLLNNSE